MNLMLRSLLNLSIAPLPAEELMNFELRFLLNLFIAPLPAKELKKLHAVFHT